jgi:hypothetical protein
VLPSRVHSGTKLAVPEPLRGGGTPALDEADAGVELEDPLSNPGTRRKAAAGSPPKVCASAAFKA